MKGVGLNFRNNLGGKHHNWKIESLRTKKKRNNHFSYTKKGEDTVIKKKEKKKRGIKART